jgi:magnesium chelatase family protein
MLAKLKTFSLLGIDALPVEVEVDVSPSGLPKTVLVGTELTVATASGDRSNLSRKPL